MSTAATAEKTNLADVAKVSELKNLGWSVKDEGDGTWTAHENTGDLRSVGPASSIKALHTQVMLVAGPPVEKNGKAKKVGSSKLEGGKYQDTQPILTGTENAVFEDLERLGIEHRENTMEILRRQKIQKTQQGDLEKLMAKFRDDLSVDDDGFPFITVNIDSEPKPVDIVLAKEEKEVIRTRTHKD